MATLKGLTSIHGNGKRGPVTERLQNMFFDCVNGRTSAHRDWLTPVAA